MVDAEDYRDLLDGRVPAEGVAGMKRHAAKIEHLVEGLDVELVEAAPRPHRGEGGGIKGKVVKLLTLYRNLQPPAVAQVIQLYQRIR